MMLAGQWGENEDVTHTPAGWMNGREERTKKQQGLDLRYLRQGYLEEDYILDLGRVETTLLDLSYWMLFC